MARRSMWRGHGTRFFLVWLIFVGLTVTWPVDASATEPLVKDATVEIRDIQMRIPVKPVDESVEEDVPDNVYYTFTAAVFTVTYTQPVKHVRIVNDTIRDDGFEGFGLTRLVCGRRVIESHPFPFSFTASEVRQQPPNFLISLPSPTEDETVWNMAQEAVHVTSNNKDDANTQRFMLVLSAKQRAVSYTVDNDDKSEQTPTPTQSSVLDKYTRDVSLLDESLVSQCTLRVLRPDNQNFRPHGAVVPASVLHTLNASSVDTHALSETISFRQRSSLELLDELSAHTHQSAWDRLKSSERFKQYFYNLVQSIRDNVPVRPSKGSYHECDAQFDTGAAAFVELQTESKLKLWDTIMHKNPLAGVLAGVTEPLSGMIGGPVIGSMSGDLVLKITSGLTKQISERMTAKVVPAIAEVLVPSLKQTVPDILIETLPPAVAALVTEGAARDVSAPVTVSLNQQLTKSIPAELDIGAPLELVRNAAPAMTLVLIKSLAHSITPALKSTLFDAAHSIRCYYCQYNEKYYAFSMWQMCFDCNAAARAREAKSRSKLVRDSLYYAAYYSAYYGSYYTESNFGAIDMGAQNSQEKLDYFNNQKPPGFREVLK